MKPICYKWVYFVKLNSDGTLNSYKVRLVVVGNKQEHGIECDETFASVAKMTIVRTILSIAASNRWYLLHQMDVKNVFLQGNLTEDIYNSSSRSILVI